jgi:hypothetical protein
MQTATIGYAKSELFHLKKWIQQRLVSNVCEVVWPEAFVSVILHRKSLPRNDPDVHHLSFLILLLSMMALLLHVPSHVEVARILLSPLKNFRVPDCTRQGAMVKLIKRQ